MLTGVAKKNYQRNYMRKRRLKGKLLDLNVRPKGKTTQIPRLDADGNPIYDY